MLFDFCQIPNWILLWTRVCSRLAQLKDFMKYQKWTLLKIM